MAFKVEGYSECPVTVVATGGCGNGIMRRAMSSYDPAIYRNFSWVGINTDSMVLKRRYEDERNRLTETPGDFFTAWEKSKRASVLTIGLSTTEGSGAGADPNIARKALLEDKKSLDTLKEILSRKGEKIILTGEGGGTGTGFAPEIAKLIHESGGHVVAIAVMPSLKGEGRRRHGRAQQGLSELLATKTPTFVLRNDKLNPYLKNCQLDTEKYPDLTKLTLRQKWQISDDLVVLPTLETLRVILQEQAGEVNNDRADWRAFFSRYFHPFIGWVHIDLKNLPKAKEIAKSLLDPRLQDESRIQSATELNIRLRGELPDALFEEACDLVQQKILKDEPERDIEIHLGIDNDPSDGKAWISLMTNGPGPGEKAQSEKAVQIAVPERPALAVAPPEPLALVSAPSATGVVVIQQPEVTPAPPPSDGSLEVFELEDEPSNPTHRVNGSNGHNGSEVSEEGEARAIAVHSDGKREITVGYGGDRKRIRVPLNLATDYERAWGGQPTLTEFRTLRERIEKEVGIIIDTWQRLKDAERIDLARAQKTQNGSGGRVQSVLDFSSALYEKARKRLGGDSDNFVDTIPGERH